MNFRVSNARPGIAGAGFAVAFAALLLAAAPKASAAEDCVSLDYNNVTASYVNSRWKVVEGGHWILDFGSSRAEAEKARDIIKHYKLVKQCFVGRPNPPMTYWKTASGFPTGSFTGEDVISFNPYNVKAQEISGTWKVTDCSNWLLDFGAGATGKERAALAVDIIQDNSLRKMGFVGRPDPGMTYFIADENYRPSISLGVTLRSQETSMWCWAASGRMAMEYLGKTVSQCTQANNRFNRTDCCSMTRCPNPDNAHDCAEGGWPEFDKYGFTFKTKGSAISWSGLWGQISCKRKPVAFSWGWVGGGGHMMVARGMRINADGTRMVQINDPWSPCSGDTRWITYDAYVSVSGSYTHWTDYYEITKEET